MIFFSITLFSQTTKKTKSILTESEKIKFLLNELEKANGKIKFIRNGEEFSSKEAKSHMQRKLDYAGDKIKTVNEFIDQIATKSSMTGNKYYVVLEDGTKIESAIWLRNLLKKLD
jgi:hypothetical protein